MFPFYQFYLMNSSEKIGISIWGSGTGSNAQVLIDFFSDNTWGEIRLIVCDRPCYLADRAVNQNFPLWLPSEQDRKNPIKILEQMSQHNIQAVVLAGYLRKVNPLFLKSFTGLVLNLHPSLLPAYGGKGMYGSAVHSAVIEAKEVESGITIHEVSDEYDTGTIWRQEKIKINSEWDALDLAKEIQKLEHKFLPIVVQDACKKILHKQ